VIKRGAIIGVYLGNPMAIFQSFVNGALLLFRAFENEGTPMLLFKLDIKKASTPSLDK
jgi:hypothetical protein